MAKNIDTTTDLDKVELMAKLKERFQANMELHPEIVWTDVEERLNKQKEKIESLLQMEKTGGEPDVIGLDRTTHEYIFCDCSQQSPIGRRSLCYDQDAYDSRKSNKPESSAEKIALEMGIKILTEEEYRELQKLRQFDTKTSSWILTPKKIRELGGALFCDCRYDTVFVYHNGAESYYAGRGFRGILRV